MTEIEPEEFQPIQEQTQFAEQEDNHLERNVVVQKNKETFYQTHENWRIQELKMRLVKQDDGQPTSAESSNCDSEEPQEKYEPMLDENLSSYKKFMLRKGP